MSGDYDQDWKTIGRALARELHLAASEPLRATPHLERRAARHRRRLQHALRVVVVVAPKRISPRGCGASPLALLPPIQARSGRPS